MYMVDKIILNSYGIRDEDIISLQDLLPRDGFEFPDEEDLRE